MFSLPVVFGVGIAALLILAAVFAGQADLDRQIGTKVMTTPGVSEEPAEPSEEPNPSDFPPCPDTPLSRPSPYGSSSPVGLPESTENGFGEPSEDPNVNTPPECVEANCWTNFEGTIRSFEGSQKCIKSNKSERCVESGQRKEVPVQKCSFVGPVSQDNCQLVNSTAFVGGYGDVCGDSDPAANCPDVLESTKTDRLCIACWDWDRSKPGTVGKKVVCDKLSEEIVPVTIECTKESRKEGQEGWWVDRSTCGYDSDRIFPDSACYQSCQVHYLDPDDNCKDKPLVPGECRLREDGPPPGIVPAPSGTPLI